MSAWYDPHVYRFTSHPANEASAYQVGVVGQSGDIRCIGTYHLAPRENGSNHNIYVVMLDERNQYIPSFRISYTWVGRQESEPALPVLCDKPYPDATGSIPIWGKQIMSIWPTEGGDMVTNLRTDWPDEPLPDGSLLNSYGHHSFLVVYQKGAKQIPNPVETAEVTLETINSKLDQILSHLQRTR